MKIKKFLSLLIVLQASTFSLHAFKANSPLDFFVVYGKRNNTIDEIIRAALDTEKNKWTRTRVPITEEFERWSSYSPQYDSTIEFRFEELDYTNHPKIKTIDDILLNHETEAKILSSKTKTFYESPDKITLKRTISRVNLTTKDTNGLVFEILNFEGSQPGKTTTKKTTNLFGEIFRDETVTMEPENIKDQPSQSVLKFVVDAGGSQFRSYSFKAENRSLSPEEKKYLLDLFKYIEEQINHVPL